MIDIALVSEIPGEHYRYYVRSDPRKSAYMVDLLENNCLGKCGCQNWEYKIQPNQEQGEHIPYGVPRSTDCKHLDAARRHMNKHVMIPMLRQIKDGQG